MDLGDAQLRAQSELQPGESLCWTGVADPRRATLSAIPAALFGIPFAGFALFWINGAYHASSSLSRSPNAFAKSFSIFPLFGLPFFLIGLAIVLAPLWAFVKGRNTSYSATNQRIMIISATGT